MIRLRNLPQPPLVTKQPRHPYVLCTEFLSKVPAQSSLPQTSQPTKDILVQRVPTFGGSTSGSQLLSFSTIAHQGPHKSPDHKINSIRLSSTPGTFSLQQHAVFSPPSHMDRHTQEVSHPYFMSHEYKFSHAHSPKPASCEDEYYRLYSPNEWQYLSWHDPLYKRLLFNINELLSVFPTKMSLITFKSKLHLRTYDWLEGGYWTEYLKGRTCYHLKP